MFSPERVHYGVMNSLKGILRIPGVKYLVEKRLTVSLPVDFAGLTFRNPVGLAAGFDKDARYIHELAALGFGFIEIGTVTPEPQPGNPKPRLFRLKKDKALINRMGFNNRGVDHAVERLKSRPKHLVIGGNIGKNKWTPNEEAINDYEICFLKLYDHVDYFVVNVSSPNTPNLRALQEKEPLTKLLTHLINLRAEQKANQKTHRPIFLKIAPDLTEDQLEDVVEIVKDSGIEGIVGTNTTIDRSGLQSSKELLETIGAGGLSGKPVTHRATEVLEYIHKSSKGTIPMIGVGGIDTGTAALEKVKAGASLVQVYTGFIYEGPALALRINRVLQKHEHFAIHRE